MESDNSGERLLVLHKNSMMSSVIDEVAFCGSAAHCFTDMSGAIVSVRPELVLQDYQLTGNDFILICRDLKKEDRLTDAPIIVATTKLSRKAFPAETIETQDIKILVGRIEKLLATFGFTYLVMNKSAKKYISGGAC